MKNEQKFTEFYVREQNIYWLAHRVYIESTVYTRSLQAYIRIYKYIMLWLQGCRTDELPTKMLNRTIEHASQVARN